jgi:5-methylcytosine-specific restriction enzyme subunit McrC
MLERGDEPFSTILPTIRAYEQQERSAPHELLARSFAHFVRDIHAAGFVRTYVQERVSGYFRPKIAFGPTISSAIGRGDPARTVSDVFSFTSNSRANGILKTACRHFLGVMPKVNHWEADRRTLTDALGCLVAVKERDLAASDSAIPDNLPARARNAYAGALTSYAIFRGFSHIGFEYAPLGAQLPSFLFSLDAVFEAFVRNVLREGLRECGLSIADGNKFRHQRPLFNDNATYPVKPDMIFKADAAVVAVGEIKHKPKIDEHDRYQLISHTLALGSTLGLWVSPAATPEAEGLQYVGSFAGAAEFWHYRLNLTSNLESSVQRMVSELKRLLPSPSRQSVEAVLG